MVQKLRTANSATPWVILIFALSWVAVMAAAMSLPKTAFSAISSDYFAEGSVSGVACVIFGMMLRKWLRHRNSILLQADRPRVSLWSNRWPLALILIGLCAVTASAFFFIQDFTRSESFVGPRTRYALLTGESLLVAIDILAGLALVRNAGCVALNESGIWFAELWADELPWTEIVAIRLGQQWAGDVLEFDLTHRYPIRVFPPRKFFECSRYGHDGYSLSVPENLVPAPLNVLVSALQKRCRGVSQSSTRTRSSRHRAANTVP